VEIKSLSATSQKGTDILNITLTDFGFIEKELSLYK